MKCLDRTLQEWLRLPFEKVFTPPDSSFSAPYSAREQLPQPLFRSALETVYGQSDLLPIESLKHESSYWYERAAAAGGVYRAFRSSGTTQNDRSLSPFSQNGLELYRLFSVRIFWAMLENFFPQPQKIRGLSLVPRTEIWPESSLAQMVEWIAAEGNVAYLDGEAVMQVPREPVWLFATAFHLVQFADQKQICPLPKGSVVIETGGTKGRSRSVSREELYELIEGTFAVPRNRIVSEYGMCELASQAYDFVSRPDGPELPLQERRFRFPTWIRVQVAGARGHLEDEGYGSLVVHDKIRSDLPWPLRTEDLVRLDRTGSFELLGRVPLSPLKGCSLLAEDWQISELKKSAPIQGQPLKLADEKILAARAKVLADALREMWMIEEHQGLLLKLLGSPRLVASLTEDLQRSLPSSADDWVQAAFAAVNTATPKRWLVIPPRTHPTALLYPIALGSLLELDLTVRESSGSELINFWQNYLDGKGLGRLRLLPASYRIGDTPAPDVGALLVYGSNETLKTLSELSPWPLQGFGSFVTATLVHQSALSQSTAIDRIWKDAFSLGQKGCMSSRLLIVWDSPPEAVCDWFLTHDAFIEAGRSWASPLPPNEGIGLVHTHLDLLKRGHELVLRRGAEYPLMRIQPWSKNLKLADTIADRPWVLPVLLVSHGDENALFDWLSQQTGLQKLSVCPSSREQIRGLAQEICELGAANAPAWNGIHQGLPLFAIRNSGES